MFQTLLWKFQKIWQEERVETFLLIVIFLSSALELQVGATEGLRRDNDYNCGHQVWGRYQEAKSLSLSLSLSVSFSLSVCLSVCLCLSLSLSLKFLTMPICYQGLHGLKLPYTSAFCYCMYTTQLCVLTVTQRETNIVYTKFCLQSI